MPVISSHMCQGITKHEAIQLSIYAELMNMALLRKQKPLKRASHRKSSVTSMPKYMLKSMSGLKSVSAGRTKPEATLNYDAQASTSLGEHQQTSKRTLSNTFSENYMRMITLSRGPQDSHIVRSIKPF